MSRENGVVRIPRLKVEGIQILPNTPETAMAVFHLKDKVGEEIKEFRLEIEVPTSGLSGSVVNIRHKRYD
ncbi:MAG: hypothetical protein QXP42_01675 [Candidatus Micrarchaeia archaeon]